MKSIALELYVTSHGQNAADYAEATLYQLGLLQTQTQTQTQQATSTELVAYDQQTAGDASNVEQPRLALLEWLDSLHVPLSDTVPDPIPPMVAGLSTQRFRIATSTTSYDWDIQGLYQVAIRTMEPTQAVTLAKNAMAWNQMATTIAALQQALQG